MQGLPERALRCVHAGAHGAWRVCLYAEKPQVRSLPHAELLPCIYSRKRHKIPRKTSESRKENRRAYRAFARMQRQIRRGKAKQDGFARRVMAVSERTSKARCPNRRANSAELSHRPEGADARNAQNAHFHAYSLGDDRLCDPLQRDVRSVYMGKPCGD